jgi:hypothetical protein
MSSSKVTVDFIFHGVQGPTVPPGTVTWLKVLSHGVELVKTSLEVGKQAMADLECHTVLVVQVLSRSQTLLGSEREQLLGSVQVVTTMLAPEFQNHNLQLTGGISKDARLVFQAKIRTFAAAALIAEEPKDETDNQETQGPQTQPDPEQACAERVGFEYKPPSAPEMDSEEEMIPVEPLSGNSSTGGAGDQQRPHQATAVDMDHDQDQVKAANMILLDCFDPLLNVKLWEPFMGTTVAFMTEWAGLPWEKADVASAQPPFVPGQMFLEGESMSWWIHSQWQHYLIFYRAAESRTSGSMAAAGVPAAKIEMLKLLVTSHGVVEEDGKKRYWPMPQGNASRHSMPRYYFAGKAGYRPGYFKLPEEWQVTNIFRTNVAGQDQAFVMRCIRPSEERLPQEHLYFRCTTVSQHLRGACTARVLG